MHEACHMLDGWVMYELCMGHITCMMHKPWMSHGWVMSYMWWMSYVTRQTYESWMSHGWVMKESWMSRGWVMGESYHRKCRDAAICPSMPTFWMDRSESCHMCDGWVMSHVWRMSSRVAISHGWVIDESCHRKCRDDAVLEYANVNTEALVSLDKRFARYTQQLKTSVRGAAKHKMQVCVWVEDANVWQASAWVWDASAWQVSVWV